MNIKNSKFKTLPSSQLLLKGFVVQTWSWMSSLISDSNYRAYDPKRAIFTPKGDNAGLGKTALVKMKIKNSKTQKLFSFPTSTEGVFRPDLVLDVGAYK